MSITLEKLIKYSGDSILLDYSFKDKCLRIFLELDEIDEIVEVAIQTENITARVKADQEEAYRTCYLKLKSVDTHLNEQNGIFVPSSDFPNFMKECKEDLSIAFGQRMSQVKWIFQLLSSKPLISCLVKKEEDISIRLVKQIE